MELYQYFFLTSGGVKDPRVHSSEDILLQEADDKLPDPTEHSAEVQVSAATPAGRFSDSFLFKVV